MARQDLGTVNSWEDVFQKATELFSAGKLTALATVSLKEFERGKYFATPLDSFELMGSSQKQTLASQAQTCPSLYPGNERFRLFLQELPVSDPLKGLMNHSLFLVVYLRGSEEIKV